MVELEARRRSRLAVSVGYFTYTDAVITDNPTDPRKRGQARSRHSQDGLQPGLDAQYKWDQGKPHRALLRKNLQ